MTLTQQEHNRGDVGPIKVVYTGALSATRVTFINISKCLMSKYLAVIGVRYTCMQLHTLNASF